MMAMMTGNAYARCVAERQAWKARLRRAEEWWDARGHASAAPWRPLAALMKGGSMAGAEAAWSVTNRAPHTLPGRLEGAWT
jgi:hypothetical protein